MFAVRMTLVSGACCMTGEMCSFSRFDENWFKAYRQKPRTLAHLAPYNHKQLEEQGFTRESLHQYGYGDDEKTAWQNALKACQSQVDAYSYEGKQVRYFWFVKYVGNAFYEADVLRQLVQEMPNVVKLGAHVNANSHNTVDGYMVVFDNNNPNAQSGEEEDDE